jgi:hypothetical protein
MTNCEYCGHTAVLEGDLLSREELLQVFNDCDEAGNTDPFFQKNGLIMLASIARAYKDHTDQLKRKDVRIQWRHEPFEGMEFLGKTAEWQDAYSTEEDENYFDKQDVTEQSLRGW